MRMLLAVLAVLAVTETASAAQINVTATLTASHIVALPPPGRSGDMQRQRWRLTDRYGRTIGRMYHTCAWVVVTARLCVAELQLPRGKVMAAGSSPTMFEGEYAVTGGTGLYRAGGGVMVFTAIGLRKQVLRVEVTT